MATISASKRSFKWGDVLYAVGRYSVPVMLILLWEALYRIIGEPDMASPVQSLSALFSNLGAWIPDVWATLSALLISFSISAVFGVAIGFFIGLSPFWSRTLNPLVLTLYAVPKIVLYPVFLLAFGLTMQGRIAFAVAHGILPIIIICLEATRTVPDTYLQVAKTYRMSFIQKARHILIPSIMPQLVVALRMGFSLCFLGLIIAELFASYEGLGSRLAHYMSLGRASSILALILIIVFVAFFFTFLFLLWQERRERKIGKGSVQI